MQFGGRQIFERARKKRRDTVKLNFPQQISANQIGSIIPVPPLDDVRFAATAQSVLITAEYYNNIQSTLPIYLFIVGLIERYRGGVYHWEQWEWTQRNCGKQHSISRIIFNFAQWNIPCRKKYMWSWSQVYFAGRERVSWRFPRTGKRTRRAAQ